MHGIGIIWHLTIHLSMTPCGLDWLEEEEERRILKRQTYMHLHTTMSPPSRQLRKYTWVLPVSEMYFQLGRCLRGNLQARWFGQNVIRSSKATKPGTDIKATAPEMPSGRRKLVAIIDISNRTLVWKP